MPRKQLPQPGPAMRAVARERYLKELQSVAAVVEQQKAQNIKRVSEASIILAKRDLEREISRKLWSKPRKTLYAMLHSRAFETICLIIILFNMALVIIETDAHSQNEETPFWVEVSTRSVLGFYVAELVLKLYTMHTAFFEESWNIVDIVVVTSDLILEFLGLALNELPSVSILRIFRLARLARAVKAARFFKELNTLLNSFGCAMKAIFWGMIMVILALMIWGILAVQLIHPINERVSQKRPLVYNNCHRCERAFSTVFQSALTLWKTLVAGDSWGEVSEPIIEEAPWTVMFFMLVLVTVSLMLLNLILAVTIEAGAAAAELGEHEKALLEEKLILQAEDQLVNLCAGIDMDGSGSITIDEFLDGYRDNAAFRNCLQVMHVTEADMHMIFNICDEDDSGDVDYREFVDQIRRIKHSSDQMMLHYITEVRTKVNRLLAASGLSGLFSVGLSPSACATPKHNSSGYSAVDNTVLYPDDITRCATDNTQLGMAPNDSGLPLGSLGARANSRKRSLRDTSQKSGSEPSLKSNLIVALQSSEQLVIAKMDQLANRIEVLSTELAAVSENTKRHTHLLKAHTLAKEPTSLDFGSLSILSQDLLLPGSGLTLQNPNGHSARSIGKLVGLPPHHGDSGSPEHSVSSKLSPRSPRNATPSRN